MQDFPPTASGAHVPEPTPNESGQGPAIAATAACAPQANDFQAALSRYVAALRLPNLAALEMQRIINVHDFAAARAALVTSVPGRHTGQNLSWNGHMRARTLLARSCFPAAFAGAPLTLQFSSIGSLTEKWLQGELADSFSRGVQDDTGAVASLTSMCLGVQATPCCALRA